MFVLCKTQAVGQKEPDALCCANLTMRLIPTHCRRHRQASTHLWVCNNTLACSLVKSLIYTQGTDLDLTVDNERFGSGAVNLASFSAKWLRHHVVLGDKVSLWFTLGIKSAHKASWRPPKCRSKLTWQRTITLTLPRKKNFSLQYYQAAWLLDRV